MHTSVPTSVSKNPPRPNNQKLKSLHVDSLKNLKDVDLQFDVTPLTAIMGANGSGKTTVLHALACVYAPLDEKGHNYKFSEFFKPNTDSLWQGSDFTIEYSYELKGQVVSAEQRYAKVDRWTPKYERRPKRNVRYLGIKECVPEIETVSHTAMVRYRKEVLASKIDNTILDKASAVMNRRYGAYYSVGYEFGSGTKKSIAVSDGEISYPALSMSSGEQRVFKILDLVFNASKSSLILIDEIDLFLHQDALKRLLDILCEHCDAERKQIIFTTHFPPVALQENNMTIYTLKRIPQKTIKWTGYSPAALDGITGRASRPIKIYAEDDVAGAIAGQVAQELCMRRYVEISTYGAAQNAFSLGAGLVLAEINAQQVCELSNILILQDGDVYSSKVSRIEQSRRAIVGDDPCRKKQRKKLCGIIRPLFTVDDLSPEQMLHAMLHEIEASSLGLSEAEREVLQISQDIRAVPEKHGLINQIIEETGQERPVALAQIVALTSKCLGWKRYTRILRYWLDKKKLSSNL